MKFSNQPEWLNLEHVQELLSYCRSCGMDQVQLSNIRRILNQAWNNRAPVDVDYVLSKVPQQSWLARRLALFAIPFQVKSLDHKWFFLKVAIAGRQPEIPFYKKP